jgi:hypothetical protein
MIDGLAVSRIGGEARLICPIHRERPVERFVSSEGLLVDFCTHRDCFPRNYGQWATEAERATELEQIR